MKKIISTKGLLNGKFDAPWTNTAIHERIDNKLAYCYKQDCRDDIQLIPTFTYELFDGQVTAIELSYTIDNPIPQRLENFRDTCEYFYELHGFMIEKGKESPRVYFRATDMFDMASLIHALDHLSVNLERRMPSTRPLAHISYRFLIFLTIVSRKVPSIFHRWQPGIVLNSKNWTSLLRCFLTTDRSVNTHKG